VGLGEAGRCGTDTASRQESADRNGQRACRMNYWRRNEEDPGSIVCRFARGDACVRQPPPETSKIPRRSPPCYHNPAVIPSHGITAPNSATTFGGADIPHSHLLGGNHLPHAFRSRRTVRGIDEALSRRQPRDFLQRGTLRGLRGLSGRCARRMLFGQQLSAFRRLAPGRAAVAPDNVTGA